MYVVIVVYTKLCDVWLEMLFRYKTHVRSHLPLRIVFRYRDMVSSVYYIYIKYSETHHVPTSIIFGYVFRAYIHIVPRYQYEKGYKRLRKNILHKQKNNAHIAKKQNINRYVLGPYDYTDI